MGMWLIGFLSYRISFLFSPSGNGAIPGTGLHLGYHRCNKGLLITMYLRPHIDDRKKL